MCRVIVAPSWEKGAARGSSDRVRDYRRGLGGFDETSRYHGVVGRYQGVVGRYQGVVGAVSGSRGWVLNSR